MSSENSDTSEKQTDHDDLEPDTSDLPLELRPRQVLFLLIGTAIGLYMLVIQQDWLGGVLLGFGAVGLAVRAYLVWGGPVEH